MNSPAKVSLSQFEGANGILATLNLADTAQLSNALRRRSLCRGERLFSPGQLVDKAIFPISATLAARTVMRDGREVQTSVIGSESAFGLSGAFGATASSHQVIVLFPGEAYEISAEALARTAAASEDLRGRLVNRLQAEFDAATAACACSLLHGATPRLCRGLLEAEDRFGGEWLPLTHEDLSTMLGVQRTTVTVLAGDLKHRGLIEYRRGRIRILDRQALMTLACECYVHETVQADRTLGRGAVVSMPQRRMIQKA